MVTASDEAALADALKAVPAAVVGEEGRMLCAFRLVMWRDTLDEAVPGSPRNATNALARMDAAMTYAMASIVEK